MQVFWHRSTRDDLAAIRLYYNEIDPTITDNIIAEIFRITKHLATFPSLGRPGRVLDTHELPIKGTKFIIVYMVEKERLIILAVYHTSRQWPETWLTAAAKTGLAAPDRNEMPAQDDVQKDIGSPNERGERDENE